MIKCPKCGMKVEDGSKFCTCCGSLMPTDASAVTEQPAAPAYPAAPAASATPIAPVTPAASATPIAPAAPAYQPSAASAYQPPAPPPYQPPSPSYQPPGAPAYQAPPASSANPMQNRDPFGAPPSYQAPIIPASTPLTPITPLPAAEPASAEPAAAESAAATHSDATADFTPKPDFPTVSAPAAEAAPAPGIGIVPAISQNPPPAPNPQVAPIITTGHWLGTMILLLLIPAAVMVLGQVLITQIPVIAANYIVMQVLTWLPLLALLIMMVCWAFGSGTNPSKRNFFRAALIYSLIMIVLTTVLVVVCLTVFANVLLESGYDISGYIDLFNDLFNSF